MMVRHGCGFAGTKVRIRRPIGLSLPNHFFAKLALTIATGCFASVSSRLKSRPSRIFNPMVEKYPSETDSELPRGRSRSVT